MAFDRVGSCALTRAAGTPVRSDFQRELAISRVRSHKGMMAMNGRVGRSIVSLSLAAAMLAANAHAGRAKADMGLGAAALGGAALVQLGLMAAGVIIIGAAAAVRAANSGPSQSPVGLVPPRSAADPAPPTVTAIQADEARRAFMALPHCDTVGGYESYRKRTGNICRLH